MLVEVILFNQLKKRGNEGNLKQFVHIQQKLQINHRIGKVVNILHQRKIFCKDQFTRPQICHVRCAYRRCTTQIVPCKSILR